MAIRLHLDGEKFDPETIRVMGLAFEMALVALRLADRGDLANDVLARKIIGSCQGRRAIPNDCARGCCTSFARLRRKYDGRAGRAGATEKNSRGGNESTRRANGPPVSDIAAFSAGASAGRLARWPRHRLPAARLSQERGDG
jgi:hypothetical protein